MRLAEGGAVTDRLPRSPGQGVAGEAMVVVGGRGSYTPRVGNPKYVWGKLKVTGDGKGVHGEVEGLHYCRDAWFLMNEDQRSRCKTLREEAKARKAAAVKSEGSGSASREIEELRREVAALKGERNRDRSDDRGGGRRSRSSDSDRSRHSR